MTIPHKKGKKKKPSPTQRLEEMLRYRTFAMLLREKAVFDIRGASRKTGFDGWHLRRLCRARKISHIMRGHRQYFFLPEQLRGVFTSVVARPVAVRGR